MRELLQPLAAVDVLEADQRRVGRRPGDRRVAAFDFDEVLHGEPVEARAGEHVLVGVDDRRRRLVAEGRLLGREGEGEIDRLLVVGLLLVEVLQMSIRLIVVPDVDDQREVGGHRRRGADVHPLADAGHTLSRRTRFARGGELQVGRGALAIHHDRRAVVAAGDVEKLIELERRLGDRPIPGSVPCRGCSTMPPLAGSNSTR